MASWSAVIRALFYSMHVGYCPFLLFSYSFSVLKRAPPLFCIATHDVSCRAVETLVSNPDTTIAQPRRYGLVTRQVFWVLCRNVGRPIRLQEQVFAVNESFNVAMSDRRRNAQVRLAARWRRFPMQRDPLSSTRSSLTCAYRRVRHLCRPYRYSVCFWFTMTSCAISSVVFRSFRIFSILLKQGLQV